MDAVIVETISLDILCCSDVESGHSIAVFRSPLCAVAVPTAGIITVQQKPLAGEAKLLLKSAHYELY